MSRKKDRLIEHVEHGPFKAEIRMTDSGVFTCEYGSQNYKGPLPEVRSWARQMLRDMCQLNWLPVMEVNFDAEDVRVNNLRNCSNIACYMERCHVAWDGKKWICCPWVVMPPGTHMCCGPADSDMEQDQHLMSAADLMAERVRRSREFHAAGSSVNIVWPLVEDAFNRDKVYYIQYTEERWQTMIGILAKIRELRAGINRLLSSEEGWLQLAVVAQTRLLAAPTDQESELKAPPSKSVAQRQRAAQ